MLICPELFLSRFLTHVEVEGDFLDRFLGSKRSTYTRVNTGNLNKRHVCVTPIGDSLRMRRVVRARP